MCSRTYQTAIVTVDAHVPTGAAGTSHPDDRP